MVSAALSHEIQRGHLNGGLVDKYRRERRNEAVQLLAEMRIDPERVRVRMRAVYGICPDSPGIEGAKV